MPSRNALPSLDLLVGFESAARHLSFTKAGEELFLTQSAVSRQIKELEDQLGVTLFQRRHRALALTEAGHQFYAAAAQALSTMRSATERLRAQTGRKVVAVTTTHSFAALWLIPRLAGFTRDHPGVDVRITAERSEQGTIAMGVEVVAEGLDEENRARLELIAHKCPVVKAVREGTQIDKHVRVIQA